MATRERFIDRAQRRRIVSVVGNELRDARVGSGLSQAAVGRAAGMSHAQVGRIERARISGVSVDQLCRLSAALGMEISVRFYPGSDPLRDAAHAALLERLRGRLHPSLGWRLEVPLPIERDRRAWDALVVGAGRTAIEAETRLTDAQAIARKVSLKKRDGRVDRVVLLIAGTIGNRRALSACREGLRLDFPLDTGEILASLGAGQQPRASGIVVL